MAWYTWCGRGSVDALSSVKEGNSGRSSIRVCSGSVKQTNLEIVSRLILPPLLNRRCRLNIQHHDGRNVLVPNHWQAAEINTMGTHFQVMLSGVGYGRFCATDADLHHACHRFHRWGMGSHCHCKFAAHAPPHTVVPADPLHDRRTVSVRSLRPFLGFWDPIVSSFGPLSRAPA